MDLLHTRKEFDQLIESEYKGQLSEVCACCQTDKDIVYHHIVPLAVGGTNYITNIASLCLTCHGKVHGKDFVKMKRLQSEGIKRAKAEGKNLGRKIIPLPKEWDRLYKEWKAGEFTAVAFMKEIGMKKATFYNKVKEYEENIAV